ncbi:adenine-specific DNA methylase [Halorubrum salipaludis]|uniref:Adenine-specific DNA methylase n=1 Tax=Halorubrum salipaludis TaxID=2032630 RepID=A0A2A2F5T9_9EURY|nr:DNA methyltransferase [Halorubrum salipaludis]PAU79999.1 adenine-specific DNA methylase [Halorubrum salipaludis]
MSQDQKPRRRPIEISFPIDQVNEIAEKEAHAKRYYRPVYTMHKWWARRLGSVFRTMLLYSLADGEMSVDTDRQSTIDGLPEVDWENPDALWDYYLEDIDFGDKTVLDPFMGGGTSIVESLRMGCNAIGSELNPVAWFVVKKEVEPVDLDELDAAFEEIKESVGEEIQEYYRTECPHCEDHHADVMYSFWANELPCRNCGESVALFKDYRLSSARSSKDDHNNVVCPECWNVFEADDYRTDTTCPECSHGYVPKEAGNVSRGSYTCPHCDEHPEMSIIESIDRFGKAEQSLYAVEYYCPKTSEKGYKSATDFDRELFGEAEAELEENRDRLPFPTTERYRGSSDRVRNHGFETYDQMFNERQLLCLSKLLDEIRSIEDQNVKEFLLLAFSSSLEFNNILCEYNRSANKLEGIYKRHTITARHTPVENNIWGTEYGRGTFSGEFDKMRAGKEFCINPYEKYVEDGETKQRDGVGKIEGYVTDDPDKIGEPVEGKEDATYNVHLRCGTSEYIPIDDNSVDAVITDPPYFDNVMYSETADFYYVWLKQVLEDEYDHFSAELTPKASEVVSDPAGEDSVDTYRDEDHFVTGLTNVFDQANQKLKDEGIMAFTFHHKETEGWSTVLKSVLEAGFYVTSLYPIRGEMRGSTHIHDKANIEYDMIVVCRSREEDPETVSWRSLEDEIYFRAQEEIDRLEESGSRLTQGDIFAVTMGKCLEVYSRHFPNVTHEDEQMSVNDAVGTIRDIVDEQLMEERVQTMGDEMDTLSAIYLTYVLGRGGTVSYNALNKDLRQRGVDVAELVNERLLEQEGDSLNVRGPLDRAEDLEHKKNHLAVDKAHYLRYLYETDQLAQKFGKWTDEGAIAALRRLAEVENDDEYVDIAEYVEDRTDTQLDLEDFS